MTEQQINAQAEFAPEGQSKATQHRMILDIIARDGFITTWGAIYDMRLHCSKLSTRIGEIETRSGSTFSRERMYRTDGDGKRHFIGTKYALPEGKTINDYRR